MAQQQSHLDSATVTRLALGECSSRERHAALAHCHECRYCRERCQAACGHLVSAWEQTVAAESHSRAANRRDLMALIPPIRPQWAQGGAVAALAAACLMLMTSPDMRHRTSEAISPSAAPSVQPAQRDGTPPAPETPAAPTGMDSDTSAEPGAVETAVDRAGGAAGVVSRAAAADDNDGFDAVPIAAAEVRRRPGSRSNAAASARRAGRFVPEPVAVSRLRVPARSMVELAPPPAIRPRVQPAPQLVASMDLESLPPPPKSKVGTFFHRAGSGVKTVFGVFR